MDPETRIVESFDEFVELIRNNEVAEISFATTMTPNPKYIALFTFHTEATATIVGQEVIYRKRIDEIVWYLNMTRQDRRYFNNYVRVFAETQEVLLALREALPNVQIVQRGNEGELPPAEVTRMLLEARELGHLT